MKTIVILLALIGSSANSMAANRQVVCSDKSVQDASYIAHFSLSSDGSEVKLFVPDGETSGKFLDGACASEQGAIETSVVCNLRTSENTGVVVRLYSIGGSQLFASVEPYSPNAKFKSTGLTCTGD